MLVVGFCFDDQIALVAASGGRKSLEFYSVLQFIFEIVLIIEYDR